MPDKHEHPALKGRNFGPRGKLALAAAGLLVLGGAGGAVVTAETRPTVAMAPVNPVPIRSLSSNGIVTIRGKVIEIHGNKFILGDASGHALIDTGREGDDRQLVTTGEPVTVQGRFERGFVHAAFLVGPDNKVTALGPLAGPPRGPHGHRGGPDRGAGAPPPPTDDAAGPPPPPPVAASNAPTTAPAPGGAPVTR